MCAPQDGLGTEGRPGASRASVPHGCGHLKLTQESLLAPLQLWGTPGGRTQKGGHGGRSGGRGGLALPVGFSTGRETNMPSGQEAQAQEAAGDGGGEAMVSRAEWTPAGPPLSSPP